MEPTKDRLIRRRLLISTASNYVGKGLTLVIWFFLTPFILHHLQPTEYGLWVLIGSVVAYGALLDAGIAGAVVKYVAEYRARGEMGRARQLVATALWLYAGLGLAVVALSAAAAPLVPDLFHIPAEQREIAVRLTLLMGLGVGLAIPCTTTNAVLRGLQRYDLVNLLTTGATLASAALTVAVLLRGGGVVGVAAVNIVVTLALQLPSVWCIRRVAPELRFGWRGASLAALPSVFAFGSSIFVMNLAGRVQTKTDELVIGAFLPVSAVTPYAIARKLSEVAQILTDQFLKVLLPLASELHAESDTERLRRLYLVGTRLTLVVFTPVAAALILLGRPLLSAWVGPQYADAATLVTILTLASMIDTSQWAAGSVLQGMTRQWPLALLSVGAALANLALSIVLVQRIGVLGVALGTLAPTAIVNLCGVLPYALRVLRVGPGTLLRQALLPALLPAAPMVIVLLALRDGLHPASLLAVGAVSAAGLLVYLAAYLGLGASGAERGLALALARGAAARLGRYVGRRGTAE
jgi:O-antigen/teichoic acid export membrane protein